MYADVHCSNFLAKNGNNPSWIHTHTHTHLRAYSAIKKERNSDICYNTNELRKHYAKWNNSDTKGQGLYDFTYLKYQE